MNERIKELLSKATANRSQWDAVFMEQFAELIVRECVDVMTETEREAATEFTYMGDDVAVKIAVSNGCTIDKVKVNAIYPGHLDAIKHILGEKILADIAEKVEVDMNTVTHFKR